MKKKFFFCIVLTYSYVEPYSKVGCISENKGKGLFFWFFTRFVLPLQAQIWRWKRRHGDIILLGCCWRCSCQCLCCRLCMYTLKRMMRRLLRGVFASFATCGAHQQSDVLCVWLCAVPVSYVAFPDCGGSCLYSKESYTYCPSSCREPVCCWTREGVCLLACDSFSYLINRRKKTHFLI